MIELHKFHSSTLRGDIIKYLKSKGEVRAVLLHKLFKRFSNKNKEIRFKKTHLFSFLIEMMKERLIEVIIPEIFEISWSLKSLSNSKYLENGEYLVRNFLNKKNKVTRFTQKGKYLFDSRNINRRDKLSLKRAEEWLVGVLKQYSKIKYKMIIYYTEGSKPLNIYDPLKAIYHLTFQDFFPPDKFIRKGERMKINESQQRADLFIIQSYRKNYMCFYITLIESIQFAIMSLMKKKQKGPNFKKDLQDLITKFGYYCEMFVKSDWVDIKHANPHRWETFFKNFDIPIKILNLEYKSIRFHDRTFETWGRFRYCAFINRKSVEVLSKLKQIGYEEFSEHSSNEKIAIGKDHELFVPCPSIEHFFFMYKYICYYHLFLLFYHSFSYFQETITESNLRTRDQELYKTFLPVMEPLFNITSNSISKILVFIYYTCDPDELEIIYNKFLVNKTKTIEKKLYKYFFFRSSL